MAEDLPANLHSKDSSRYFGSEANNNLHNDARDYLMRQGKKGDLNSYSLVKNYSKYREGLQAKLIADKKVIHYTYNGKEIYRNNAPWSKDEIAKLNELYGKHQADKQVAQALGRSTKSVVRKRQKLGIKENVRTMEGFRSMFGE